MRLGEHRRMIGLLIAAVALAVAVGSPAAAGDAQGGTSTTGDSQQDKSILKIGWAQNPSTINPFVGQDEEAFSIWAINWDLLVNFSPKDLTPVPGIAQSWDISDDKKTITFHLDPTRSGRTASRSPPRTSSTRSRCWAARAPCSRATRTTSPRSRRPTRDTVVIHTKRPDARIVGGLFIYILPKHVWGKVPVSDLTGSYDPKLPLVGSGPYVVTDFEPNRITTMEQEPELPGAGAEVRRDPVHPLRQPGRGRAGPPGRRGRHGPGGVRRRLRPARRPAQHRHASRRPRRRTRRWRSTAARRSSARTRSTTRPIQDPAIRQATAYAVDRERINEIAARGTSFPAHGILPSFYKSFYEVPAQDYPYDPEKAKQILDDAGWQDNGDSPRTKGGEEPRSTSTSARSRRTTSRRQSSSPSRPRPVGIDYNVQVVSTDKLYDLTVRKVNGKPAPDYDTFIWGWGGDPYDPSFLLSILTTGEIGGSSDSFYSNPTYDRLYKQQAGEFDNAQRKEIIQRMVALTQRDLPYLVLTYDPNLEAYRTDRVANVKPVCPEDSTGRRDLRPDLVRAAADDRARAARAARAAAAAPGSRSRWSPWSWSASGRSS